MGDFRSRRMRAGAPTGSPTSYTDKTTIDKLLAATDPGAVAGAGTEYQKFAGAYDKIVGQVQGLSADLSDAWSGPASAAAQSQLREVWASAKMIQDGSHRFGVALERHGSQNLAFYANNKPPSKNLSEAQQWMTGANQRITETWGSFPQDLTTTLPPPKNSPFAAHGPAGSNPPGRTSSSGTGGSGSPPSLGGSGGGGGSSSHGGHTHPGYDHGGADLAGLPPTATAPGGASGTLPPGSGAGGLPGGGTSDPLSPGGGGFGPGGGGPFGPVLGGQRGLSSGLGSDGRGSDGSGGLSAEEASAAEANAARNASARQGMAGPMGGAGGGSRDEQERTRESWLTEDEDVWIGDAEVAPPVVGAISDVERHRHESDEGVDDPSIAELEAQLSALKGKGGRGKQEPELSLDDLLGKDWDAGLDV